MKHHNPLKPYKPVRFYASKDFHIQEGKWTRKVEDLWYYCDIGDTLWRLVDDKVRREATGQKHARYKHLENMFNECDGTGVDQEVSRGSGERVRRDPVDYAPERAGKRKRK